MSESHNVTETIGMKRHYWLRESFTYLVSLMMEVTPTRLWADGHRNGLSIVYPKTTLGASRELHVRGLDTTVPALEYLIRRKLVRPLRTGRNYQWEPEHIDQAAEYFDQHRNWAATTHFCRVANLEFGQVVSAYRVAAARDNIPLSTNFDLQYLTTVIEPTAEPGGFARVQFYPRGTTFEQNDVSMARQEVTV